MNFGPKIFAKNKYNFRSAAMFKFLVAKPTSDEVACQDDEPEVALVVGGRHPGHYFIDSDDFNDVVTRSLF